MVTHTGQSYQLKTQDIFIVLARYSKESEMESMNICLAILPVISSNQLG